MKFGSDMLHYIKFAKNWGKKLLISGKLGGGRTRKSSPLGALKLWQTAQEKHHFKFKQKVGLFSSELAYHYSYTISVYVLWILHIFAVSVELKNDISLTFEISTL